MEYLSTKYGLITETDQTTENGQLFLAEYIILRDSQGFGNFNDRLNSIFDAQLFNSKVKTGLYNRNPELTTRTMSHDNLSGIFSWSKLTKTNHRFEIWKYLLKHLGTYDNTKNTSKQLSRFLPFNPSNFFIWGLCAESNIYVLFLPFYILNLLLTLKKPLNDTSGKILTFIELYVHKDHWLVKHLYKHFEKKMKKQYGENYLKELFSIYFGNNSVDFPINKLLGINNEKSM